VANGICFTSKLSVGGPGPPTDNLEVHRIRDVTNQCILLVISNTKILVGTEH
jgi:hypothetical protein